MATKDGESKPAEEEVVVAPIGDKAEDGDGDEVAENGEDEKKKKSDLSPWKQAETMFKEMPLLQQVGAGVAGVLVFLLVLWLLSGSTNDIVTGQIDESDRPEKSWGTYYDPKEIFCGKYDCYKILGFDHELWGREGPPDIKNITKNYRSLSRKWHPDKNKSRGAKERFVKITRAYEVLTDRDRRKEYDHLRSRPDEYFRKYGASVLYHYAPKSNTIFVILLLLGAGSAFTWWAQKHKWQQVADRLTKAAVEGLNTRDGGTPESLKLREDALKILRERSGTTKDGAAGSATEKSPKKASKAAGAGAAGGGGKVKMNKQDKAKKEMEDLRPIVEELVAEMKDFGGGYHQPTWRDLMVVQLAELPVEFYKFVQWEAKYRYRRQKGKELNDEEKQVLCIRTVGKVTWLGSPEEERKEMIKMKIWESAENLLEYQEKREFRQLSMTEQKKYKKAMKRGLKTE